ncbi:MAG: hypothetical protein HYZ10_11365 [Ignavibacteriales bacterium]|nr:hypothetical protein [Ignavibacteriales bacterium]
MVIETRIKPKISTDFIKSDGSHGTRGKAEDWQTVRNRIFDRLRCMLSVSELNVHLLRGVTAYNVAAYDPALKYFNEAVKTHPELAEEIRPHIRICKRVLSIAMTKEDISYHEKLEKWKSVPRFFKFFKRLPDLKIRCKYCGHYTSYIDPEEPFPIWNRNNCEICSRSYPVPDFAWDGIDGQAYIYYRGSVSEKEFYKEFEEEYDVS